MNNKKKDNVENKKKTKIKKIAGYSAYIYLALAVCIVAALTIGIFTMSYDYTDISTPQVSIPEVSLPQIIVPDTSESPVQGTESNVDEIIDKEPVYVNPVKNGTITKEFSVESLVFSDTMQDYRVHTGVDISAELGSAVCAYSDGTVAEIKDDPFYGTTVVVEHSYGMTSYYMNLAAEIPEAIKVGSAVEAGDIIGAVGATARVEASDEPHLHFELRVGGELIDPKKELEAISN